MAQKIAPWLQGLEEVWEVPKDVPTISNVSSASHNASSIHNNGGRIPRRSQSGLRPSSQGSTRNRRNPLAPLSRSNANTLRRPDGLVKVAGSRSLSVTSDESIAQCGTVQIQPRAKSTSPTKIQETLEWKRRLVQGRIGYGDQTDLFGPSGLENIFAPSSGQDKSASRARNRMAWLNQASTRMPSSPPVFSSSDSANALQHDQQQGSADDSQVVSAEEGGDTSAEDEDRARNSILSNPFDLHDTTDDSIRDATSLADGLAEYTRGLQGEGTEGIDGEEVQYDEASIQHSRQISGRTELEQEDIDFSPVFISKHTTMTGHVDYAALDSHTIKNFQHKSIPSRREEAIVGAVAHQPPGPHDAERSMLTDAPHSDSLPANPDLSMSENLPTGTPPATSLGQFVEFKRGGYSAYGSFKERPLSSSPSKIEDYTDGLASELLSPAPSKVEQTSTGPTPPMAPTTPLRPGTPDVPKIRSSGSPLKLFGPHDTFTSNRLLRRMSQLNPEEGAMVQQQIAAPQMVVDESTDDSRMISGDSFGSGELDDHAFTAEITITGASDSDKDDSAGSPNSEISVPGARTPSGFRFEDAPSIGTKRKTQGRLPSVRRNRSPRRSPSIPQASTPPNPTVEDLSEAGTDLIEPARNYDGGKRPPTSPFKNPTPKRRRTLHASEIEVGPREIDRCPQHSIGSIRSRTSSRKQKDARQGESHNVAEPEVLAQRRMLRPRNPTPGQDRRHEVEAEVREAAEEFAAAQDLSQLEAVMEQIESSCASDAQPTLQEQAEAVATEVAAFTLRVSRPSAEHTDGGMRKRSVTTQDFLNEAMMVMNLIRAKARRPQSGLGSVEESDAEAFSHSNHADESAGSLRVSRPPSREGRPSGWRTNVLPQNDARIVSHLRRFQEKDDTEFISESLASLGVDEDSVNENVIAIDKQANIRITGPVTVSDRYADECDARPESQRSNGSTFHTQDTSTGQTIGTNSTRHSDNVGTLAPDAVTHLIGEQVGTMTFNKEKQCWMRVRSSEKNRGMTGLLELPSHVSSDDDPFREISDLPVDEQLEFRRVSANTKTAQGEPGRSRSVSAHDQQQLAGAVPQLAAVESRTSSQDTVISRPVTREGGTFLHHHSSSLPSRHTVFTSSQAEAIETRTTSWGDEQLQALANKGKAHHRPLAYTAAQVTLALRSERNTVPQQPTACVGSTSLLNTGPDPDGTLEHSDIADGTDLADDSTEDIEPASVQKALPQQALQPRSMHHGAARQMSLRKQTLTSRFAAGAREENEISMIAALSGQRVMSLSLSVSRPGTTTHCQLPISNIRSSPCRGDSTFMLSDLPDFTIHEEDADRPSEHVLAKRLAKHAAAEIGDRFALATKDLVKTLTDVQEEEPYWEDLTRLDLHKRSLSSLHGLEQFCERVQDMDVSSNTLTHLDGAPSTIRKLAARSNQLSNLTGWTQLYNLQYLDISGNKLKSLLGLSHLVHLRELIADDNTIEGLEGVMELDGLLKLSLRRNQIKHVDFSGCQLQRLAKLDLRDNQITAAAHLEALSSLDTLNLDRNPLQSGVKIWECLSHMQTLTLRGCALLSLDVSALPHLRVLDVDDNSLADIDGISELRSLDLLSMRRQILAEDRPISILNRALEARTLNLSGNMIPTLNLTRSFLSLQHLEVASVGLRQLSDDFGLKMPNLRTLNLNFNAVTDLRPLLNIGGLERLQVCGNRVHRLRKSVATLAKMPSLERVDLRDCPMTQGFYAPVLASPTSLVRTSDPDREWSEDEQAAVLEEAKYSLPRGMEEQDSHHSARMDEGTKLRRRVYELMLANSCPILVDLDGLAFDGKKAAVKDGVFDRLVALNIVRRSTKGGGDELGLEDRCNG